MKIKRIIIVSIIVSSLAAAFALAADRPLEVQYPSAGGTAPTTTQTPLADYVAYLYRLLIIISGLIALGVLIASGIRYLTSVGNPVRLGEAKQQLLSAFWGTLLLLASYLLLYNISPQLLNLNLVELPFFKGSPAPPQTSPPSEFLPKEDFFKRLQDLTEKIESSSDLFKKTSANLKSLTDKCDCKNTQPVCACNGGGTGSACEPKTCYAGANFHPCVPNVNQIKNLQKNITDLRDEILYYGNRAFVEKNDLKTDSDTILSPKVKWYNEAIASNQALLSRAGEAEKQSIQKGIDYLVKSRDLLQEQIKNREDLMPKLDALSKTIAKIESPASELGKLPNFCFLNVRAKCQPSCKTGGFYGCHDARDGCQPDKCSGGKPCPVAEIQSQINNLNQIFSEITSICNRIVSSIGAI